MEVVSVEVASEEASMEVASVEASMEVASAEAFVEASVEVASVEPFMGASVEVASVKAFIEASVEVASVEAFVEASVEVAPVEVPSVGAFMKASTAWKRGSFHGSFHASTKNADSAGGPAAAAHTTHSSESSMRPGKNNQSQRMWRTNSRTTGRSWGVLCVPFMKGGEIEPSHLVLINSLVDLKQLKCIFQSVFFHFLES